MLEKDLQQMQRRFIRGLQKKKKKKNGKSALGKKKKGCQEPSPCWLPIFFSRPTGVTAQFNQVGADAPLFLPRHGPQSSQPKKKKKKSAEGRRTQPIYQAPRPSSHQHQNGAQRPARKRNFFFFMALPCRGSTNQPITSLQFSSSQNSRSKDSRKIKKTRKLIFSYLEATRSDPLHGQDEEGC